MAKPEAIEYNGKTYYAGKDLLLYDKEYFVGTKTCARGIIVRKNIPDSEYVYLEKIGENYVERESKYKKANVYITCKWINKNMESMAKNNKIIIDRTDNNEQSNTTVNYNEHGNEMVLNGTILKYFIATMVLLTVLNIQIFLYKCV